jgi:hypothetical protein
MTGIPAVTFDASGLHPLTMERLGLDPAQARASAADGQVRAYAMHEDLLTQVQEGFLPTALAAPDALGHQIIVKPEGELDRGMVERALEYAGAPDWIDPHIVNQIPIVRDLLRAAISHEQQIMIDTLLQQQPWEPGYENPASLTRDLVDLVPQAIQDDFARNTNDLVRDVQQVIATDFANGRPIEGSVEIIGDVVEGVFNSTGDVVSGGLDAVSAGLDARSTRAADDLRASGNAVLATVVEGASNGAEWLLSATGTAAEAVLDVAGNVAEKTLDVVGKGAQAIGDGIGWLFGRR